MWKSIPCTLLELRLDHTLKCGQSFRWREATPGLWIGVIGHHVWKLKQDESYLYYKVFSKYDGTPAENRSEIPQVKTEPHVTTMININLKEEAVTKDGLAMSKQAVQSTDERMSEVKTEAKDYDTFHLGLAKNEKNVARSVEGKLNEKTFESELADYFQLNINLEELYKNWSDADPNFKEISTSFQGIRMLRQDPIENLFSFICSSNNHINRISSMVEKLCDNYGNEITNVDGKLHHAFPKISELADSRVEAKLRELGFGYRAKYINTTARYLCENQDERWLYSLRSVPYRDAKRELMKLCGVGAKVADCVCLMSMDKPGTIPVDTHVWQIASRHYMRKLQNAKSLTDRLYEEIGDYFRSLWGEYAGWAHSVLFAADLKHFKDARSEQASQEGKKSSLKRSAKTINTKRVKLPKKP